MYPVSKRIKFRLAKHKLFQLAVATYKKDGFLEISIDSCEKWNYPETNGSSVEGPRTDGTFDVEGHTSCDVNVRCRRDFFSKTFLFEIYRYFKDLKNSDSWDEFKLLSTLHPFAKYFTAWLWVVDSFIVARNEYALKIVDVTKPKLMAHKGYQDWNKEVTEVMSNISDVDLGLWLSSEGSQISSSFYVNDNDPTVFTVNEKWMPFSMKNGWSDDDMRKIIGMWFRRLNYNFRDIRLERKK